MIDQTPECQETIGTGRKTRLAHYGVLGTICVLVIGVYAWSAKSGWLELAGLNASNNYYNLLVQGFRAGQLNLKKEVRPGLAQRADAYDPVPNSWLLDLSCYRGKLYLYFGVTPALLLFWPWYELTSHYLLHRDAVVLFCVVGFLAGAGLLVGLWRRYFAKVGVGVVGACILALGLAGGTPLLLARSEVYEVAISCGYALTMLALAALWRALHDTRRRSWWLAAASLAYGLALGARPSLLLGAVILLVPVAQSWRETAEPGRRRRVWTLLLAAAGPIVLIGLGLMLYNVLRFDNPLEFGQRYQLTAEPKRTMDQFSLSYLWFNFRVSFLEPVRWSGCFPFVHGIAVPPMPKGSSIDYTFGLLSNIPLVWLALAVPLAWRGRLAEARTTMRWFVVAVALLLGTCALVLCLHDSMCLRYEVEFAHTPVLLAVIGILGLESALAGRLVWRRAARWGWGLLLVFSVAFNLFGRFQIYSGIQADLGLYVLDEGRMDEAITHFQKALEIRPNNALARNGLGKALLQKGMVGEAISEFQQALEIEPGNASTHFNLGAALFRLGQVPEAIGHLEQALRLKPGDAETHNNLGAALFQLGQVPEAIGHLEQALRLKPGDAEVHNNLGKALVQLGRMAEAIGHYEQALQIKPSFAEVHNNLGAVLTRVGKVPEGIGHYEQALQLRPEYADAHYNLGTALFQVGKVPEAIGQLEWVLRLKPESVEAHNNLGAALYQLGKVPEAVGCYEQALRLRPEHAGARNNLEIALFQLGEGLAAQGKWDEAIRHYERAVQVKPDNAQAYDSLGLALSRCGRFAEAVGNYEKALAINARLITAQNHLAWLLATCGEGKIRDGIRAIELAERVNKLAGGKDPGILDTLAAAYAEAGRYGEAVRTAQAAIELVQAAGQVEPARQMQERLQLYQAGRPYREGTAPGH